MSRILVIDEEKSERAALVRLLGEKGYETREAGDVREAFQQLEEGAVDLVLSDVRIGDRPIGMELLERLQEREHPAEAILFAGHGNIQGAVDAVRKGAYDVLGKPFDTDLLLLSVQRALERRRLKTQVRALSSVLKRRFSAEGFVYRSRQMEEILKLVQRVSQVDTTVLIQGESGTGKELISRAIHAGSRRKNGPFHVIDCGTIPENLLESEFFGYEKGAFTGAVSARKGLFEVSSGGTLLLDEVGELPFLLQVKLLRVLQEREIRPLGSDRPRKIDVRILAATNKNLQEEVDGGRFREDLFYRLNVIPIRVPPLRDRPDDILPVAEYFLQKYGRKMALPPLRIDPAAAHLLLQYRWPGNVRELENAMQRAVALTNGDILHPEDLPETVRGDLSLSALSMDAGITLEAMEKRHILHVLKNQGGNRGRAAAVLGIGRNTLWRKLKSYGVPDRG
jgi:two-component system, NtrC family, response regulator AtoC